MKKYLLFFAFALCAVLAVSCGNNRTNKSNLKKSKVETHQESVELAEDVLAIIDSLEEKCRLAETDYDVILNVITSALTDEQKLVKPDYLLDPAHTEDLLSHRQKVNALVMLLTERPIREAYGMPIEESDKAIARLYIEVGHPVSLAKDDTTTVSDKIRETYRVCKENNELCYFWLFDAAVQYNLLYLISYNSDTFFNNITPEQYAAFNERAFAVGKAVRELAQYSTEISSAVAFHEKNWGFESIEDAEKALATKEDGKALIDKRHKDYVEYRTWVLL